MRQEIKDQWFALNDDDVADTIMDLSDAVADKDVDYAKEILENLPGNENDTPKSEVVEKETPAKKETPKKAAVGKELTEEESEIIEDIKSAIDDGDEKDFKELLAELKEVNPDLANEWADAFVAAEDKDEEDTDSVVDEIIEDLEAALADGDTDEAKECLEELGDEVGTDSDIYKEYAEKLAPKKSRRERRGK